MDRIPRATESIADKAPIVVETATPTGFTGIRTIIQLRMAEPKPEGFAIDAVINTEVRKGPRSHRRAADSSEDFQSLVTDHHLQLAQQLIGAIAIAHHTNGSEQPPEPDALS